MYTQLKERIEIAKLNNDIKIIIKSYKKNKIVDENIKKFLTKYNITYQKYKFDNIKPSDFYIYPNKNIGLWGQAGINPENCISKIDEFNNKTLKNIQDIRKIVDIPKYKNEINHIICGRVQDLEFNYEVFFQIQALFLNLCFMEVFCVFVYKTLENLPK